MLKGDSDFIVTVLFYWETELRATSYKNDIMVSFRFKPVIFKLNEYRFCVNGNRREAKLKGRNHRMEIYFEQKTIIH